MSAAQYFDLLKTDEQIESGRGTTRLVRAANCVLAWTHASSGERLRRTGQQDEYVLLTMADSASVRVRAGAAVQDVHEPAFVVVPPGDSEIEALAAGLVIRLFSARADDLTSRAINAEAYARDDHSCAPLGTGPEPVDGFTIRMHRLADHPVEPDRFGRIFRTAQLMVNVLAEQPSPRDPSALSPHAHADFEQLSLAITGEFLHHLRYPWGPDSLAWRPDEHTLIGSPSLTVIPPTAIHTSQGVGQRQQLVDIFAPPRADFCARPGWVRNAAEYPSP